MQQIKNINEFNLEKEDITKMIANKIVDNGLLDELQKHGIQILPYDDLSKGIVGFILFNQPNGNEEEKSVQLIQHICPPVSQTILEHSSDSFTQNFNDYMAKNIYVCRLDDMLSSRLGYIAMCNNGIFWHQINLADWIKK